VSDLFDDGVAVDDYDDDVLGEVADDNQQGQMVLERLPYAASSSVTGATSSIIGSRAKTRQNQVASAVEATSFQPFCSKDRWQRSLNGSKEG
jgi:hypothetical protein